MGKKNLPTIIKEVGFDFNWSEEKVWSLDIPVETISLKELEWHLEVPFWSTMDGYYNLKPSDVIIFPKRYQEEYHKIMKSNLSYPIDIMANKGRWLILDGLHRLAKAKILKKKKIKVRKIPRSKIPEIVI